MIVLSQFVSVYALPLFPICYCGGLVFWQQCGRQQDAYQNVLWRKTFWKMAMTYAWLGFVDIFTFVESTFSESEFGEEQLKLAFSLKDMFMKYKYFVVIIYDEYDVIHPTLSHGFWFRIFPMIRYALLRILFSSSCTS